MGSERIVQLVVASEYRVSTACWTAGPLPSRSLHSPGGCGGLRGAVLLKEMVLTG